MGEYLEKIWRQYNAGNPTVEVILTVGNMKMLDVSLFTLFSGGGMTNIESQDK